MQVTNRNTDSNDQIVNEFKLTVVHFARPNPLDKKTEENEDWTTGPTGRRAVSRGSRACF